MKVLISQYPFLSLLVSAGSFVPLPAWAGEAPEPDKQHGERSFGDLGELAISGATQLRLDHDWSSFGSAESQATRLMASGDVDYFVLRGLSLGASVGYSGYDQPGFPASSSISLGPRVGYNVPLAPQWSLWPDVYGAYNWTWSGTPGPERGLAVGVYVPVLYHPARHFFIGIGPEAMTTVFFSQPTPDSITAVGLSVRVGGWIGS